MDNRSVLFGLHELEGIGWHTIAKIRSAFSNLEDVVGLPAKAFQALHIRPHIAERLAGCCSPFFIEKRLHLYKKQSISFVTIEDDAYPDMLRHTAQPPWVLYYKGNISYINQRLLGMVGTRTPTTYGKKVAEELAASLSAAGFGIVSGLARGIDSKSHIGALQGKAGTVGVLGCAIDHIYPRENALLYKRIEQQGAIISEYPIGTRMHPGLFPQRNRIIAGLALGVIVVEAAEDSGSLITVHCALEESRDVFAVPGPITSPTSRGTLALLKQGAKIVTSCEDLIEDYKYLFREDEISSFRQLAEPVSLTEDEQEIVRMLSNGVLTFDELLERGKFTFGHLHSVLLSLSVKKAVKQLPGSAYTL